MAPYISDPVIRRLPAYYRYLRELEREGTEQISSQDLGERMQLTPSQIRQDINSFGGVGRQGYGYNVHTLKEHIRQLMGLDREHPMVILGAGRMGLAVANYTNFSREGFRTVAFFDRNPDLICPSAEKFPVFPAEELEERLPGMNAEIGVLAVPAAAAQDLLDRLYALGIRAIWNFAPVDLQAPQDMVVVNVHLSDSLHILSYQIRNRNE